MTPKEAFQEWRNPRRGNGNGVDMTNPFWVHCVNEPQSGFCANQEFGGASSLDAGPCWSFERFGQTKTELPDGTIIYIAGEHEDSYDPDFYIYNDVTIIAPSGDVRILGYDETVFPPTDFHTASLARDEIILIGNLGYPENRKDTETPVYILNTKDFSIRKQETQGGPGWISDHNASIDIEKKVITVTDLKKWTSSTDIIDDFSTWELDLKSWQWRQTAIKNWTQHFLYRADGEHNSIFERRHSITMDQLDLGSHEDFINDIDDGADKKLMKEMIDEMLEEQKQLASTTSKEALETVYYPSIPFTEIPRPEPNWEDENTEEEYDNIEKQHPYNHFIVEVEAVILRFIEDSDGITLRVEGELDNTTLNTVLNDICNNLEKIEGAKFISKKI